MSPYLLLDPAFDGLVPSSTLHINETVNRFWREGKTVHHMGFGESRFDVHPKLQRALADNADKKSYLPAKGLPDLTSEVAAYYSKKLDRSFNSNQVIIGPGSKAIIYGLQMVLNAHVFLPTPSWVSYGPQATILGRSFSYIPSDHDDNYSLDIGELDKLVRACDNPCKLLIINSPNNPTGQVMDAETLRELAEYCREHKIWVLSDEIYFEVCYANSKHKSISTYYPEGTFVLGGLSKHLSIGGWRLGVGLMPDTEQGVTIMQKLAVLASETWSGVSAPVQYAAIKAYEMDEEIEQYVADCREIHRMRTQFFRDALLNMGIKCTKSEGGFYITPNFDSFSQGLERVGIKNSRDLADHLLHQYSIASLPGIDFGIPEKTHSLRLSTSYLDIETEFDSGRLLSLYQAGVDVKTFMSKQHHPNVHGALDGFQQFVDTIR
ncbi:MAG: pyridoxal phosphate-dependent aminotransferase [Gammaproteobacteria bacterium]|nr:pyridoxal phosphate-dependent aminotransferase [Gammaproteobacteria bacterium]